LPLVISPHGRNVRAAVNASKWAELPAQGRFALICPGGMGRKLPLASWGWRGQIADLARMPEIVRARLPWLRLDPRRIYAVGGSMGGQETLLLLGQYPRLLGGAGAIDSGVRYTHTAVNAQYRGRNTDGTYDHNYNWHDPSNVCGAPSLAPCDNNDHGTHTMGTMVGDDAGPNQVGVAPRAKWMTAKGCETNTCSRPALLSSAQFILAPTDLNNQNPRPDLRPHIVNNSWGGNNGADTWYQASVQAWVASGIFPSFSNGNAGQATGTATRTSSSPGGAGTSRTCPSRAPGTARTRTRRSSP